MTKNLLAMAVGIKQKKDVDEIVQKVTYTLLKMPFSVCGYTVAISDTFCRRIELKFDYRRINNSSLRSVSTQ